MIRAATRGAFTVRTLVGRGCRLQVLVAAKVGVAVHVHRNLYLDTPRTLRRDFAAEQAPWLYFAGQITGVEGYVESILSGLWTAWQVVAKTVGRSLPPPPRT